MPGRSLTTIDFVNKINVDILVVGVYLSDGQHSHITSRFPVKSFELRHREVSDSPIVTEEGGANGETTEPLAKLISAGGRARLFWLPFRK